MPHRIVKLRPFRQQDYSFAERLYRETQQPLLSKIGGWDDKKTLSRFKKLFRRKEVRIILLGDIDVGWMQISESANEINIHQIHIEEEFRSRGIGTKLIRAILDYGRKKNKSVALYVVKNNPAQELYKRLGFTIIGEGEHKLHMRWRDIQEAKG